MASEQADKLYELFRGLDRAHGKYTPQGGRPGEKVSGSATTVRGAVTPEVWEAHLDGTYGLGVVPIREDSTAFWGAIDVDEYKAIDHKKIVSDVDRLGLPLVVARTKSGGAHLYLFTSESTPATLVRGKLMEWAVALGYPGVEVFPKQVKLADTGHDVGNWLNMPYFAGDRTTRYAFGLDGLPLSLDKFIETAYKARLTFDQLEQLQPYVDKTITEMLRDGPPCLQSLGIQGFPDGTRNNAMFNLAVYLRKRYPDDWGEHIHDYNERFLVPPLSNRDVVTIKKSVDKKSYNYKCNDQPICNACSRQICLTRRFGVGGNEDDPGVVFGDLVQIMTEPEVSYIWDIDGVRVQFANSSQILDQRAFHKLVMDRVKKLPNFISEKTWRGIVREKLEKAETIIPPADTTPTGQLFEHLQTFLTQRAQAREFDELLLGRPFTKGNVSKFRLRDFIDHLKRVRYGTVSEKQLLFWLRHIGATADQERLKGRSVRYWTIKDVIEEFAGEYRLPQLNKEELDG